MQYPLQMSTTHITVYWLNALNRSDFFYSKSNVWILSRFSKLKLYEMYHSRGLSNLSSKRVVQFLKISILWMTWLNFSPRNDNLCSWHWLEWDHSFQFIQLQNLYTLHLQEKHPRKWRKNYEIGIHHNWEISITSLIDTQIWSFTSKFDFSSCSYSGNNLTSEHL